MYQQNKYVMTDREKRAEALAGALGNLGADPKQARTMAKQLLKRAAQLAVEKTMTEEEALEYLLRLTWSGSRGTVDPAFYESEKESKKTPEP